MRGGVDQTSSKGRSQEVSKSISLLQHTGYDTSCTLRAVFESSGCCVAVQPAHRYSVHRSNSQELLISLAEPGCHLQHDEENKIGDERPFSTEAICCQAKDDRSNLTISVSCLSVNSWMIFTNGSQPKHVSYQSRDIIGAILTSGQE